MTDKLQPQTALLLDSARVADAPAHRAARNRAPRTAQSGVPRRKAVRHVSAVQQYLIALGVVLGITLASFVLPPFFGHHAIALIFLLAVVVLGSCVGRGPTLLAAALSAVLWDYFFLVPIHSLRITSVEDGMVLGMYFVIALVLGHFTMRIRAQEDTERQREQHATMLFLLTRELTEAGNLNQLSHIIVREVAGAFAAQVVLLLPDARNCLKPQPGGTFNFTEPDESCAAAVFEKGLASGNSPAPPFPEGVLYLPLASAGTTVGVMGLRFNRSPGPTVQQRDLLVAFSEQIALALNRLRLNEVSERARRLAESERLSKTLLDSISHEIRTPIAAIKSAAGNLSECKDTDLSPTQCAMVAEIHEATERLNRLVGNLLDITRLESGAVKPRLNECDVRDLIHLAVTDTEKELARHQVTVDLAPDLPVVLMDFVLIQQALTNLLSNAACHTRPGTAVKVSARVAEGALLITVADDGPGIHPKDLPLLFNKFHRGSGAPAGGAGLGLSLVKGFVQAHGGQVRVANSPGGGAAFTISLPLDPSRSVPAPASL